ncbi:MAG TPA: S8 family serine peptidase [Thermoanaerobaculia bacterium]|nr:S8 family serine peptidase [Thermoanaerobaculia bacterium]
MKRNAVAALICLLVAAGATAEETQRYLVATKQPFRAGALAGVVREARQQGVSIRDVVGFEAFDGFAASLTSAEVAALKRNSNVRWIEPVVERHAFQSSRKLTGQTIPYGLDVIRAREAWAAHRTATVNVVVIDTGVDYRHPELAPIWAGGRNMIALPNNDDPFDDNGHGTHVAGTIAAANNAVGVVGVAPDVRLWGVKVLSASGSGSNEGVLKAIDWIIGKKKALGGQWVANLSLGSRLSSLAEKETFQRGIDAGIIFVAASGNESTPELPAPVAYPAAYPGVLSVGAIDAALQIASFSNQGPELDVVAPGVGVLSTVITGSGSLAWVESQGQSFVGAGLAGAKLGSVTGEYVYCGLGKAGDCPAEVAGKIALVKRGEIRFSEKTRNAKEAGAVAVAIFNHEESAMNWTLITDEEPDSKTYDWPVTVGIAREHGEALAARNAGTITITNAKDDYGVNSGTSMAAPHVAAAVALIWSIAPNASAAEVLDAVTATASDLGASGRDIAYGAGVVNTVAAVKRLAPAAIDPANPAPGSRPTTGRRILKRG